jgi:sugar lactone lactonase YvrE
VRKLLYVSDMHTGSIYVFSSVNDKLIKRIPVDHKINTIKLSPDRSFLFASSRGPNNEETYLIKGPQFGKLYVIDTTTFDIVDWVWGRNQPTGLGISMDGEIVAFSDFKDANIEVYRFKKR